MRLVYTISAVFAVIAIITPFASATAALSCDAGFPNCVTHCSCATVGGAPTCNGLNNNQWVDCTFHCGCIDGGIRTPPPSPVRSGMKASVPGNRAAPANKAPANKAPAKKAPAKKAPLRKASIKAPVKKSRGGRSRK